MFSKMSFKILIFFVVFSILFSSGESKIRNVPLEIKAEWNLLEFGFPSEADEDEAISSGNWVPENATPIDVALSPDENKTFVTIPRFSTGIPYTLATVNSIGLSGSNGPILEAYPSYDWHNKYRNGNCDGIVSAFRVAITECNQMWVIDSGIIEDTQYCPPQLLLFDLSNDSLIHRYQFDSSVYTPANSLLVTPVAYVKSTRDNCQKTMIYIGDVDNHGLVVYDYAQNSSWRVVDKWMYPDPDYGTFTIAGESFTMMDGIFGMTTDKKNLYFHALASLNEIAVPLSVLNNRTNFESGAGAQASAFKKLGSRESPCAAEAIDRKKNIYCVTLNPIKLIKWNVRSSEYSPLTFTEIPIDSELLEFVSGMKVVKQKDGKEYLWMMSNRFQKIAAGTQNVNEVNFRITRRAL